MAPITVEAGDNGKKENGEKIENEVFLMSNI
jgi:hypothetical protein